MSIPRAFIWINLFEDKWRFSQIYLKNKSLIFQLSTILAFTIFLGSILTILSSKSIFIFDSLCYRENYTYIFKKFNKFNKINNTLKLPFQNYAFDSGKTSLIYCRLEFNNNYCPENYKCKKCIHNTNICNEKAINVFEKIYDIYTQTTFLPYMKDSFVVGGFYLSFGFFLITTYVYTYITRNMIIGTLADIIPTMLQNLSKLKKDKYQRYLNKYKKQHKYIKFINNIIMKYYIKTKIWNYINTIILLIDVFVISKVNLNVKFNNFKYKICKIWSIFVSVFLIVNLLIFTLKTTIWNKKTIFFLLLNYMLNILCILYIVIFGNIINVCIIIYAIRFSTILYYFPQLNNYLLKCVGNVSSFIKYILIQITITLIAAALTLLLFNGIKQTSKNSNSNTNIEHYKIENFEESLHIVLKILLQVKVLFKKIYLGGFF